MEISQLILFNVTLLAALLSPGPALLMAIRATLVSGFKGGILVGAGLATMAACWTALALLGLDAIFTIFPWAYLALKIGGASYLIWIAILTWRDARSAVSESTDGKSEARAFMDGFLVNLANPKSVLFASAVLLVIFPQDMALAEKAFVVLNHLLVELICYTGFALLLSSGPARRTYLRAKLWMDRFAAVVMGALGLRLLISR